jgi:hypothetical protein
MTSTTTANLYTTYDVYNNSKPVHNIHLTTSSFIAPSLKLYAIGIQIYVRVPLP